jgi:hypothetical protein
LITVAAITARIMLITVEMTNMLATPAGGSLNDLCP